MSKCVILSFEQKGDYLRVKIEHNGSAKSSFHLSWDGVVMKSLPPIATVKFKHELVPGKKKKTQVLDFDLSAMRHFGKTIKIVLMRSASTWAFAGNQENAVPH